MAEPLLRLEAIGVGISVAVTAPIKKAAGEVLLPRRFSASIGH
jgi:hypothetical protein